MPSGRSTDRESVSTFWHGAAGSTPPPHVHWGNPGSTNDDELDVTPACGTAFQTRVTFVRRASPTRTGPSIFRRAASFHCRHAYLSTRGLLVASVGRASKRTNDDDGRATDASKVAGSSSPSLRAGAVPRTQAGNGRIRRRCIHDARPPIDRASVSTFRPAESRCAGYASRRSSRGTSPSPANNCATTLAELYPQVLTWSFQTNS